jgi:hypothetical protein
MKYKAIYNQSLKLLDRDGNICKDPTTGQKYQFVNGELTIVDTTTDTAGYRIEAVTRSTAGESLNQLFTLDYEPDAVDWTDQDEAIQGGGLLISGTAGNPWAAEATDPYWNQRLFYKAPTLTSSSSSAVSGLYYKVLTGTAINSGTTYVVGDIFQAVSTTVTGTGTFELETPPKYGCEYDAAAEFKKKLLVNGDETIGYGTPANGFTPMISNSYSDTDFIGTNW